MSTSNLIHLKNRRVAETIQARFHKAFSRQANPIAVVAKFVFKRVDKTYLPDKRDSVRRKIFSGVAKSSAVGNAIVPRQFGKLDEFAFIDADERHAIYFERNFAEQGLKTVEYRRQKFSLRQLRENFFVERVQAEVDAVEPRRNEFVAKISQQDAVCRQCDLLNARNFLPTSKFRRGEFFYAAIRT